MGSIFDTTYFESADYPIFAKILHVMMCMFVPVIALNALIALLSDSFDRVQQKYVEEKNYDRAQTIVEYMQVLPTSLRTKIADKNRYFHRLLPYDNNLQIEDGIIKGIDTSDDEWTGRLNEQIETTRRLIHDSEKKVLT